MRHVNHLRDDRRIGHADLILLLFLQQIEIEAFLHLLITLDADEMFGLRRVRTDFRTGLSVVAAQGIELDVKRVDLILNGRENIASHLVNLRLLLEDKRILGRCAQHVVLQREQHAVVLVDLRLHHGISDARVRGQQLIARGAILENVEHILRHGALARQAQDLGVRLALLLQIDVADGGEVGDLMARLEIRDTVVHAVELLLDQPQAVLDEVRRAGGHLPLVVNPLLVVDRHNAVEHALRHVG